MSLLEELHEYLRETVDVSVHETRLPTRPMMPALVQHLITAATTHTHSQRVSVVVRRLQIDAYSNSETKVDEIATRVLLALDRYHGPMGTISIAWAHMLNDQEMPPDEVRAGEIRYRRTLDFEVAYQERSVLSDS